MLNWKIRYAKIIRDNPDLFDAERSVLEVGGGSSGLAAYLDRQIVCLDKEFSGETHRNIIPVLGSADAIGYTDDSFDIVVCVDVLEHIPAEARKRAIAEMIRVARDKVIISFPCRDFAETGEAQFKAMLERSGREVPVWLQEHIRNGLPSLGDVVSEIVSAGYVFTIVPNEGFIQHYSGIILDTVFPIARDSFKALEDKSPLTPPIYENDWDYYYSFIITARKTRIPATSSAAPATGGAGGDVRIYAVHHEAVPTGHLGNVIPLYVGNAARTAGPDCLTDQLADGSSLDNGRWSELSAIYKIWKEGPQSDIVGFCHYRRLFQSESATREIRIRQAEIETYDIDQETFGRLGGNFIVTPREIRLSGSTFAHYCAAHNANHICRLYELIERMRPDLLPHLAVQFHKKSLYANNMFIMNWENFDELCQLWFSILPILEEENRHPADTRYQMRYLSFLAERLFDIWIHHKRASGTPVIETGVYFLEFDDLDVSAWSPTR